MSVDFTAIFRAQDRVSKELGSISKQGNSLNSTFKKLAATAAGVFSVAKIVEFGTESVSAFTSFENGMNEVFTLLPQVTGEAMAEMSKQAKQAAKDMGVLPEQTVPALYQAISAGVPKDNVFTFLEDANKAAVGGVTSLETAVDGLSTVVNSYGADIMDAGKASDIMFTTVKLGKTNFEELSASLFNVLPTAASAGIKFEEVSAALAAMTAQGVPTSVATTQLRQAFVELTKSGTDTDKTFRKLAGKGFKEFIAEGNTIQDAFILLEEHAEATGLGINDLFGSVEAGNAVLSLTGRGTEAFSNALAEMENSAGATDQAFSTMERGFARTMDKIKAKIALIKIDVGEKLVASFWTLYDTAVPVFQDVKDKAQEFYDWGKTNWPTIKAWVVGIGSAFLAWKAVDVIGATTQALLNLPATLLTVKTALTGTTVAQMALVKAKIVDKYETLALSAMYAGDFLKSIWTTISAVGASTTAWIVNTAQVGAHTVATIALKGAQLVSTGVTAGLTAAQWALNAAFIASPIGWVVLGIGALIAIGVALWKNWDTIKIKAVELWEGICTAFAPIGEFFGGIWEGVKSGFKAFINFIIGGLNMMIRGINKLSVDIPDWVPIAGGKNLGFSIPEIPMFAKGTKKSPNTFIAGEEGPELITGAQGSRVFPSDDTDRILSAISNRNAPINTSFPANADYDYDDGESGGKTFNININGKGEISAKGISKDDVLDILIAHLKPILMKIIQTEIFEEGDLAYDF
ncbi:phage tail tape measure protein [Anaerovorax sp. IOR16]|uniref:phage tail tape measure protein n=1 Tax=Anaerovorax sp. IOR16 TaxID=2773458 RepID=UPI0019D2EDFC|nr:phage tail tape measure protein [Anaerovorax sp. IOR16]